MGAVIPVIKMKVTAIALYDSLSITKRRIPICKFITSVMPWVLMMRPKQSESMMGILQ